MAFSEDQPNHERIFSLHEATGLIPQLETHLVAAKEAKTALVRTKDEIKKASANAHLGGGSVMGAGYIHALQQINEALQAIHEMGVIVKDLDMGLCDFPYLINGRRVYLCWKLGEETIGWWHEVNSGYASRHALSDDQ